MGQNLVPPTSQNVKVAATTMAETKAFGYLSSCSAIRRQSLNQPNMMLRCCPALRCRAMSRERRLQLLLFAVFVFQGGTQAVYDMDKGLPPLPFDASRNNSASLQSHPGKCSIFGNVAKVPLRFQAVPDPASDRIKPADFVSYPI